ncbi:lamin tail domain-containing protein [Wenjunlia tyrosinilytica]|uniref:LTD domain-containing protein n=1 Tax=Wenjunlia tyrosinilytica TaxID=1544741 RepID=A0A917ZKB9_9ACTN|nr:lamin tail domain-containing protein [Wenjunlia tyrosinilytica]GGO84246.1 hypothetical protein GCM10012280_15280 [Wenjunlia tyrosinilytica]
MSRTRRISAILLAAGALLGAAALPATADGRDHGYHSRERGEGGRHAWNHDRDRGDDSRGRDRGEAGRDRGDDGRGRDPRDDGWDRDPRDDGWDRGRGDGWDRDPRDDGWDRGRGDGWGRGRRGAVVFEAIQYDARGVDLQRNRSLNGEWVSLVNNGRRSVQLEDYTITDRQGHTYTFDRLRLRTGEEVVVHTGSGRDNRSDVYQGSNRHLYDNQRGQVVLRNDRGSRLDECRWDRYGHGYKTC